MRARNLKPEFFVDEDLGECKVEARLLFAGLWCVADRLGRLEDRPKRLKGLIFPYDSIDVEPLLAELQSAGLIERYEIAGHRYIAIPNFLKHQTPYYNERASIIPPPPNYDLRESAGNTRKKAQKTSKRALNSSDGAANAEQLLASPQTEQIQRDTASACPQDTPEHNTTEGPSASGENDSAQQLLATIEQSCPDSCLLIPDSGSLIPDVLSSDSGRSDQGPVVAKDGESGNRGDGETIKKHFPFRFSLDDQDTGNQFFDQGRLLAEYRKFTGNQIKPKDGEIATQIWAEGCFTFPALMELMELVYIKSAGRGIASLAYFKHSISEVSERCIDSAIGVARNYIGAPAADYRQAVLREVRREVAEWSGRILKEAV